MSDPKGPIVPENGQNFPSNKLPTVSVLGRNIQQIIYRNQPVFTLRMIDELHDRPEGMARKAFHRHKHRFIEGQDYFRVPYQEWSGILKVHLIEDKNHHGGSRSFMNFITTSGYLMIIKTFNDDYSWQVQKALGNNFFHKQEFKKADDKVAGDPDKVVVDRREFLDLYRERTYLMNKITRYEEQLNLMNNAKRSPFIEIPQNLVENTKRLVELAKQTHDPKAYIAAILECIGIVAKSAPQSTPKPIPLARKESRKG